MLHMRVIQSLADIPYGSRILIYGVGGCAIHFTRMMEQYRTDSSIVGYLDSFREGEFLAKPQRKPSNIEEFDFDLVVVASAFEAEIVPVLLTLGIEDFLLYKELYLSEFESELYKQRTPDEKELCTLAEYLQAMAVTRLSTRHGDLRFCFANRESHMRARRILDLEPDTLTWIDSFLPGEIFFDIGANVGTFSLYAGKKGAKVFAFEPASANYELLNRNIWINRLDNVSAFCLAFDSSTQLSGLYLASMNTGAARNNFAEPLTQTKDRMPYTYKQGMLGFSLDDFLLSFALPCPNHIKIDVDGNEAKICAGAQRTLADPQVKSIMVEIFEPRGGFSHPFPTLGARLPTWQSCRGHAWTCGSFEPFLLSPITHSKRGNV